MSLDNVVNKGKNDVELKGLEVDMPSIQICAV